MNVFEAIDMSIDKLSEENIDETVYYDTLTSDDDGQPVATLNIHALRLLANLASITIHGIQVIKEPHIDEKGALQPSEYVISATAQIIEEDGRVRQDISMVTQPTHHRSGKPNPNFREIAITRAKRNAVAALVPAQYYLCLLYTSPSPRD